MKRLLLACGMMLSAIYICAQSGSATWMSQLPDNAFVAHLSLPGSHDAATGEGVTWGTSYWAQVQGKTLDEQWNSGIRVFDIRVKDDNGTLNLYHGSVSCKINFKQAMDKITGYVKTNPTEFAIVLLHDENNNDGASPWNTDVAAALTQYDNLVESFRTDLSVSEVRGKVIILTRDNGGTSIPYTTKIDYKSDNEVNVSAEIGDGRLVVQDIYNQSASGMQEKKNLGIKNLIYGSANRTVNDMTWYINHASGYTSTLGYNMSNVAAHAARTSGIIIEELDRIGGVGMIMMDFAGSNRDHLIDTNSQKLTDAIVAQNFKTRPFEIQIDNSDLDTNTETSSDDADIIGYDGWTLTATEQSWRVNTTPQHCFNGRYAEAKTTEGSTLGNRTMSRKVTLPPGTYYLSCSTLTTGTGAKYFLGTTEADIANSDGVGTAQSKISFTTTETQEVEFGVSLSGYTGYWFAVDNFSLTTSEFASYGSTVDLDITPWLIANPSFKNNNGAAWTTVVGTENTTTSSRTDFSNGAADNYENTISMLQTANLPTGYYELKAKGFERAGLASSAYYTYKTAKIYSNLVAGDNSLALNNIFAGAPTSSSGFEGTFFTPESGISVPENMPAANSVMASGYYDNTLPIAQKENGDIELGVKIDHKLYGQWTVFDDFQLLRKYSVTIDNAHTFTPISTTVDVILDRSFSNDNWTLLVLPFDVSTPSAVFGDVEIAKVERIDGNDLHFSTQQGQNIEANVPVLIRGTFNEKPYRFENASIVVSENEPSVSIDNNFSLVGTYSTQTAVSPSSFVIDDNQLNYIESSNVKINPTQAYVKQVSGSTTALNLVVDGTYVTGIDAINGSENIDEIDVFDLFGRKIEKQQMHKGIYIINGKKVIMK